MMRRFVWLGDPGPKSRVSKGLWYQAIWCPPGFPWWQGILNIGSSFSPYIQEWRREEKILFSRIPNRIKLRIDFEKLIDFIVYNEWGGSGPCGARTTESKCVKTRVHLLESLKAWLSGPSIQRACDMTGMLTVPWEWWDHMQTRPLPLWSPLSPKELWEHDTGGAEGILCWWRWHV